MLCKVKHTMNISAVGCAIIIIIAIISIIISIIALVRVSKAKSATKEPFVVSTDQVSMCDKNKDDPIYSAKCCIGTMTEDQQQRNAENIVQYVKQFPDFAGLDEQAFIDAYMKMDCEKDFNLESIFQKMQSQ